VIPTKRAHAASSSSSSASCWCASVAATGTWYSCRLPTSGGPTFGRTVAPLVAGVWPVIVGAYWRGGA